DDDRHKMQSVVPRFHPRVEIRVDLLVNAISVKKYKLASELVKQFPKFASESDVVLMEIAKTFPSGDYGQSYPLFSWTHLCGSIYAAAKGSMSLLVLRGLLTGEGNETISLTVKILSVVILMGKDESRPNN
ncbi:hypothetical protein Tco_1120713, partial [Tanacetum coccineum]